MIYELTMKKEIVEKGVTKSGGGGAEYIFLSPLLLNEATSEVSFDLSTYYSKTEINDFGAVINGRIDYNVQKIEINRLAIEKNKNDTDNEISPLKDLVNLNKINIETNKTDITNIQTNYANKNKLNVFKETGTFEKDLNAKVGTFASLITPQVVSVFSPNILVVNKEALFNVTGAIEVKVNDIDGEQIVDKGNIELNKKNIEALALKQESALKYRGIYDSTETYDKNDIVAIVVGAGKVDTYLSLINNNTQPLSDKASWFETPDLSVSVDLTNYYTKIETNDLLRPLQTDLDTINAQIVEGGRLINVNIAGITANAAGIATNTIAIGTNSTGISTNKTAIGTNKTAIDSNKVLIDNNKANILANNNNINTLNTEVVKLDTPQTIVGDKVFQNGLAISSSNYKVDVNGAEFEFKRGAALANASGRDANKDTHFTTKKQLDELETSVTTAIATRKSNITFVSNAAVWTGDVIDGKKVKEVYFPQRDVAVNTDVETGINDCAAILDGSISRKTTFGTTYTFSFAGSSKGSAELNLFTDGKLKFYVATDATYENKIGGFCKYLSTEVATRAEIKEFSLKNTPVENNVKNKNKWYNKKTK